jgi:hypothetical protein
MAYKFKDLAKKIDGFDKNGDSKKCWALVIACGGASGRCTDTQIPGGQIRDKAFDEQVKLGSTDDVGYLKARLKEELDKLKKQEKKEKKDKEEKEGKKKESKVVKEGKTQE